MKLFVHLEDNDNKTKLRTFGAIVHSNPVRVYRTPITCWDFWYSCNITTLNSLVETVVLHSTYSYIVSLK